MNTISPSKLLLVARSWSQRGQNTDFEQFFSFFPGSINITSTPNIMSSLLNESDIPSSANFEAEYGDI